MLRHTVSTTARCLSSSTSIIKYPISKGRANPVLVLRSNLSRNFSEKSNAKSSSTSSQSHKKSDGSDSNEIVLTPGEKVVVGTRLTMWGGAAVMAGFCAYYAGKELFPTKMSPNSVFNNASNLVLKSEEVKIRFGAPMKVYGRDHGGHREGRRNFIEHTEYTDKDDGSKRTRVRFNLQGQHANAFVFAEVSKDMPSGEFVYLLVQDKRNGRVITLVDNRSKLLAQRMGGGDKDGQKAFANLLGAGRN